MSIQDYIDGREITCVDCHARPADPAYILFCGVCKSVRNDARQERERALAELPPMTWEEWVRWLLSFGFVASMDLIWALEAYERWGRHLPYAAGLSESGEFEYAMWERVCDLTHDETRHHPAVLSFESTVEISDALCDEDWNTGRLVPLPSGVPSRGLN